MKTYTFKLVVSEGNDEFWEDIEKRNVTGCEEVKELITQALWSHGIYVDKNKQTSLILKKFKNHLANKIKLNFI